VRGGVFLLGGGVRGVLGGLSGRGGGVFGVFGVCGGVLDMVLRPSSSSWNKDLTLLEFQLKIKSNLNLSCFRHRLVTVLHLDSA